MRALLLCALALAFTASFSAVRAASAAARFDASLLTSPLPLWSTYRPNLYFGMRARHPLSPLFGLLHCAPLQGSQGEWATRHDSLRHDAEERDNTGRYGFVQHDARRFGVQQLLDPLQKLNLTMEHVVSNSSSTRWAMRITGHELPRVPEEATSDEASQRQTSVSIFWYVALPSNAQSMSLDTPHTKMGIKSKRVAISVDTATDELASQGGKLTFQSTVSAETQHPRMTTYLNGKRQRNAEQSKSHFWGLMRESDQVWDVKPIVRQTMIQSLNSQFQLQQKHDPPASPEQQPSLLAVLPDEFQPGSNLMIVQHIVRTPFTIEFAMFETNAKAELQQDEVVDGKSEDAFMTRLLGQQQSLSQLLSSHSAAFNARFDRVFAIESQSINAEADAASPSRRFTGAHVVFARSVLSQMLGGIGYFSGTARLSINGKEKMTPASTSLLSTTPTRSFFPRGFLWDEGFHQLLVSQFDLHLSCTILDSWLDRIHPKSGWLPREMILGEEARKRVPQEFQLQRDTIANPPTLILTMGRIVHRLTERNADAQEFALVTALLQKHWPRLQLHADWYFKTQSGHRLSESKRSGASRSLESATTFRWAGRTIGHCLASGLDDAPRADFIPSSRDCVDVAAQRGCEGHVDLHNWMTALTRTMSVLAHFMHEQTKDAQYSVQATDYQAKSVQLQSLLDSLHWSRPDSQYCDYVHRNGTMQHVCHVGYISLFPLLLGQVPLSSTEQLTSLVAMMSDTRGLLSPFGLRSLSPESPLYGTGEDYWRRHIWINVNYMAAVALKHYSQLTLGEGEQSAASVLSHTTPLLSSSSDPITLSIPASASMSSLPSLHSQFASLYSRLRESLVNNLYSEYASRGFLFEQYHAETGEGRKAPAFTGWTALVVNLMAQKY